MSVQLLPNFGAGVQFMDDQGNVLAGGLLYTYVAGSTTPQTTYSDATGVIPNPNPIVLTSAGRVPNEIWAPYGVALKLVLQTSAGAAIANATWDNIGSPSNTGAQWLTAVSGTNTIVGTATPAPSAYAAGQQYNFSAVGANTGAVTLNVSGLGAKAVTKDGTTPLAAGDISGAGAVITVTYNGTAFQLVGSPVSLLTVPNGGTGSTTFTSGALLKGGGTGPITSASAADVLAASGGGALPPGFVGDFAMNAAPTGWLLCDGSAVSRTTYAALFAAIGTTWGVGDGSTTFNVPDMRGYFRRSYGTNSDGAASGAFATKVADSFKSHTHTTVYQGMNGVGSSSQPSGGAGTWGTIIIGSTGGAETAPKAIAVLTCIKT